MIEVSGGLLLVSVLCSLALVFFGVVMARWRITRYAALVVWDRGLNWKYNWKHHTLRSSLEFGSWISVMWCTYLYSLFKFGFWPGIVAACFGGSVSGLTVVLSSEKFIAMKAAEEGCRADTSNADRNTLVNVYVLLSILVLVLGLIFQYCQYVLFAVFLSTFASIAMILAGDFFVRVETTRSAGFILQDRIQRAPYNWRNYFLRSVIEFTFWQTAMYLNYCMYGQIITAVQAGAVAGIMGVLTSDAIFCSQKVKMGEVTPQIVATLQTILKGPADPDKEEETKNNKKAKKAKKDNTNCYDPSVGHNPKKKYKQYTMKEVGAHNTVKDCWLVYNGHIYTGLGKKHPGGTILLERFAGCEVTDEIVQFHQPHVIEKYFPTYCIGKVTDPLPLSEVQKDFRQLYAHFLKEDFFSVTTAFYIPKFIFQVCLLVLAGGLVIMTESNTLHMLSAVLVGFFWQQISFWGHDAGHNSVTHSRTWDARIGMVVGNLLSGISMSWWKHTHNAHHAVPNSIVDDPDICHLPIFAVSSRFFQSIFHTFHSRVFEYDWLAKNIFVPYQHNLYYPVMMVARFNLYLQSVLHLIKTKQEHAVLEGLSLFGCLLWFSWLVSHCNTGWMMLAYVLLSHACAGLLNVQITLSHFAMATNGGKEEDYGGDFFTRNIEASMDIISTPSQDWFHGGLQFQTLHHVFPRMPRYNVRKTQPFIRALCKKHGILYLELSFFDANKKVYEHLRAVAKESKGISPEIWDSVNARG